MASKLQPGVLSTFLALMSWNLWWIILIAPLVSTPLPYTPTLLPLNFTTLTTYALQDATAQYSSFDYTESGHVLQTEHNAIEQTRNTSFAYSHQQSFSGVTCYYHVPAVVNGYDSDGHPQADPDGYPLLEAPNCGALVAFRGLLIALIILPFLTLALSSPEESIKAAEREHGFYAEQFVLIGDGNRRGEGQARAPDESPSSSRRSAPPSYHQPGYTIAMPDPVPPSPLALPAQAPGAIFHPGAQPPAYQLQPLQQPQPIPPRRPARPPSHQPVPQGPRHYLPLANVVDAALHLRREADAVRSALRAAWCALVPAGLGVGMAVASLACMVVFVWGSGLGEPRSVGWGAWSYLVVISLYLLLAVVECGVLVLTLVRAVVRHMSKDRASWRRLVWAQR